MKNDVNTRVNKILKNMVGQPFGVKSFVAISIIGFGLFIYSGCSKEDKLMQQDSTNQKNHIDNTERKQSATSGVFTLYLSPYGSDNNNGLSPSTALLTLYAAQIKLKQRKPVLDCDVEIRIRYVANKPYAGQHVVWNYTSATYSISFMPSDYHGGDVSTIAGRPVFAGNGYDQQYFFELAGSSGRKTNIRFYYIRVEGYVQGAIRFHGNMVNRNSWNGSNTIYGCYFYMLGNKNYNSSSVCYGAVDLVNSDSNFIRNNHFIHLENKSGNADLLHAVYVAHSSDYNRIEANNFYYVSGDPVRVRDYSNYNKVFANKFNRTGSGAFISDWYDTDECKSWENEFRNNTPLGCGYSGQKFSNYWRFVVSYPSGRNDCPGKASRLHTSGNAQIICP